MKILKFLLLGLLNFGLIGCVSAQNKDSKTVDKSNTKAVKTIDKSTADKSMNDDTKVLAEGAYSKIEQPFILAARSNETYARLQNLAENLPPVSEIDFSRTAVVAAFAGEKSTGGYSVSIKKTANKIFVQTINPPKDAMNAQVITAPFKVVLVSLAESDSLDLEVAASWKTAMRNYKIVSGAFEYSGDFAGTRKEFDAEGIIGVLSFGDNATLFFNLAVKGAEKARKLSAAASGLLKDGKIDSARLDAGSFAGNPSPLKVSGTIADNKLSLVFEPFSTDVADGFQGRGKIEAVRVKRLF